MTQSLHPDRPLRIGTRGSPLARAQAEETRERLLAAHDAPAAAVEIHVIRTSGDAEQTRPLSEIGGKGLFTKEIEEALLERRIDIAVHSMKDVPTILPDGLILAAYLPREDARDAFISRRFAGIADLPEGAVVGSSSLRRQAQLRNRRPDLRVVNFRGNVGTRLGKLDAGEVDATMLAVAGLRRLGMEAAVYRPVEPAEMLPAIAQGAIGIEARERDERAAALLAPIDCAQTRARLAAERAFLAGLDGSCRTPIGGLARLADARIDFAGEILRPDGSIRHATRREGPAADAAAMGADAAAELRARGGPRFFEA